MSELRPLAIAHMSTLGHAREPAAAQPYTHTYLSGELMKVSLCQLVHDVSKELRFYGSIMGTEFWGEI